MRSNRRLLFTLLIREPRIPPLRTRLAQSRTVITSLHAQTSRKNELTDGGAETAQEGVEGLYNSKKVRSAICPYTTQYFILVEMKTD